MNINTVMGLAESLGADTLATEALVEACIQETTFTNNPTGSGTSSGILQFEASTAQSLNIDPMNVTQCVTAFLTRAYSAGMVGYKGAIDYAKKHPNMLAAIHCSGCAGLSVSDEIRAVAVGGAEDHRGERRAADRKGHLHHARRPMWRPSSGAPRITRMRIRGRACIGSLLT